MSVILQECMQSGTLQLAGTHRIHFSYAHDVVFERWKRMAPHPNAMRFQAWDAQGACLDEELWYSTGGGFIAQGNPDDPEISLHDDIEGTATQTNALHPPLALTDDENITSLPYPFTTSVELIALCETAGLSIAEIVMANETAMHSEAYVHQTVSAIWNVMRQCVYHGCTSTQRTLPGGLQVPRRASEIYQRLNADSKNMLTGDLHRSGEQRFGERARRREIEWVDLFALAVSEENAGGGRIVTAPTNGSAGIIPSVLHYYWHFVENANEQGIEQFLLTATAIGYLFKRNASISGAEVGCQGEVGSACSMAAAGLCAVLGGTPAQVENAAEIGIEHNLGLTCDPVGGLVQIPCIERNAMASVTAINAAKIALLSRGRHMVSLDQAIATMKETGYDMMEKYKETSRGGLAVNVVEC
jgi:L-serine dehydratase